jgi:WD40 repeat protein
LAPAVQRGLQRLAKPWHRARALRVFRDESTLSAAPHLWAAIQSVLDDAAWFVLLASPEAARSEWVDRELRHWLGTHATDQLVVVLSAGSWLWDADSGGLRGDAVPPSLTNAFENEPRHVDLSWAGDEVQLDLHNGRFRDAIAQSAAPIHGVARDTLEGEDVRLHRRARRLARAAVCALAVLVVVSVGFGSLAYVQRGRAVRNEKTARANARVAEDNARVATAERLAAQSDDLAESDPRLAVLLAAEGFRLQDLPSTRRAILMPVGASLMTRVRTVRDFSSGLALGGALAPDGTHGVVADNVGSHLIDFVGGRVVQGRSLEPTRGYVYTAAFSPDGRLLATNDGISGLIRMWDAQTGERYGRPLDHGPSPLTYEFGKLSMVAFSPDHGTLASASQNANTLRLWSTRNSQAIGPPIAVQQPRDVVFSPDGRLVAVGTATGVTVVDVASGRVTPHPEPFAATAVEFSDARTLLVGGANGALQRWSLPIADGVDTLSVSGPAVVDIGCARRGPICAVVRGDEVRLWNAPAGVAIGRSVTGVAVPPIGVVFTSPTTLVTVAGTEIVTFRVGAALFSDRLPGAGDAARARATSGDGTNFVVSDERHVYSVIDGATGHRVGRTFTVDGDVDQVGVNSGTARAAYVRQGRAVSVVDLRTGRRRTVRLGTSDEPIDDVAADGRLLFHERVGPVDALSSIRFDVVAPSTGTKVQYIAGEVLAQDVAHPQFAPDGESVLLAQARAFSDDRSWTVYRLRFPRFSTARKAALPAGATAEAGIVRSSRDRRLVAAAHGSSVQLLDGETFARSGNAFAVERVSNVALSADGALLAAADASGTVTLWDTALHQMLATFQFDEAPTVLGFVGRHASALVLGGAGRTAVLDLRPAALLDEACRMAGRRLTTAEWKRYLGARSYQPACTN